MKESFTKTIEVHQSPSFVFARLKNVSKWWGGADLAGKTTKIGDEFTITHGDAHYSKQRVIEALTNKRIVWLVTESRLNWLQNDKSEWTGTKMIFEFTTTDNLTRLQFTHEGLTPDKESYSKCTEGWTMVITEWLFAFITNNKAHF